MLALAWLIFGYFTIVILVVLAEGIRCVMGLAAFGAVDDKSSSYREEELLSESPPSYRVEEKPLVATLAESPMRSPGSRERGESWASPQSQVSAML